MKRLSFIVLLAACFMADPSFAGNNSKVTICHIPPGNPDNPQTITVSESALGAHLAHGDSIGECQSGCQPGTSDCNDGNLCTSDTCLGNGECEHIAVNCDDGNPCTLDVCLEEVGCVNLPSNEIPCDIACDDGNPCTENDVCADGTCIGTPVVGGCCINDVDCEDGNLCTTDICTDNICLNEPIDCSVANQCLIGFCDPATGECSSTPVNCDDSNICTDDSCDLENGCVNTPTSSPPEEAETSCDDGLDNDCDGTVDCNDSDCDADAVCQSECQGENPCDVNAICVEIIGGGFDCICQEGWQGSGTTCSIDVGDCWDGIDNDEDGFTDCADTNCDGLPCNDENPNPFGEVCTGGICTISNPL